MELRSEEWLVEVSSHDSLVAASPQAWQEESRPRVEGHLVVGLTPAAGWERGLSEWGKEQSPSEAGPSPSGQMENVAS